MVDGHSWLVVNTHPHKETTAAANLQNQGFVIYCPVVRKRVRHARTTRHVLRALFPGYLFLESNPSADLWRPVLSTVGVRTLVRNGDEPGRLDARFIATLRAREQDGVVVAPVQAFQEGQKIQITDGPFDGTIATIIGLAERDRLVVLLDILSRPVRVHLDARHIAPLQERLR